MLNSADRSAQQSDAEIFSSNNQWKKRYAISEANRTKLDQFISAYENGHNQQINQRKSNDVVDHRKCNRLSPTNTRQCAVCLQNKTPDQYDGHYSDHCQHTIRRICNECVYKHTKFTLANINNTTVTCPEPLCHEIFNYEGIYQILEIGRDRILFDRYDLRLTVQCLKKMSEFVMCAYPECNSGQLYDSDVSRHCKVTCIKCGRDICSFHGIPWHTGLTCDEYDQKGARDPSKNWIRKHTKQCPKCHWNIEKNGGCDHMTCKKCKHEFCWNCSVDYRTIMYYGAHKHRMTCIHYRPRVAVAIKSAVCTII